MALVKLYAARDSMEAHYLRSFLEADGIRATVMGDTLSTARGELPPNVDTLPSVWVNAEDADRALEAVSRFRMEPTDVEVPQNDEAWECPNCGEIVEGQFTECWKCQQSGLNGE